MSDSDGLKWYEVQVKFGTNQDLLISVDDTERLFQAVRNALEPFVTPKQLDISQVKPVFISHERNLRDHILQDLKVFRHVTNKGYANLRADIKRLQAALGFNLKGGLKDDL